MRRERRAEARRELIMNLIWLRESIRQSVERLAAWRATFLRQAGKAPMIASIGTLLKRAPRSLFTGAFCLPAPIERAHLCFSIEVALEFSCALNSLRRLKRAHLAHCEFESNTHTHLRNSPQARLNYIHFASSPPQTLLVRLLRAQHSKAPSAAS